jgi:hypothetical protein
VTVTGPGLQQREVLWRWRDSPGMGGASDISDTFPEAGEEEMSERFTEVGWSPNGAEMICGVWPLCWPGRCQRRGRGRTSFRCVDCLTSPFVFDIGDSFLVREDGSLRRPPRLEGPG